MKPLTPSAQQRWSLFVLVVLHTVGVVGILSGWANVLLPLSSVNLMIAAALLIALNRPQWNWWWLAAPALGFLTEVIGVQTGWLFGAYSYGSGLGPQLAGVPVLLGLLWLMMLWGRWSLVSHLPGLQTKPRLPRILLAATAMTALDGLIEPVAIRAGWWAWHTDFGAVPWTNYASWFGIAACLLAFAPPASNSPGTSTARGLFLIFTAFFTLLNLFPWTL